MSLAAQEPGSLWAVLGNLRERRDPKHGGQKTPSGIFPGVGTEGKWPDVEWKPTGQCGGLTNLTFNRRQVCFIVLKT